MGFLTREEIESNFIDNRNRELWDKLASNYTIGVNDDYSFYKLEYASENEEVYILTDKNYNKNLFTHELLHLNLRYNNFNSLLEFPHLLLSNGNLIENQEAIIVGSICNCIEHILFFDDYIEMGFDQDQFVMDYYTSTHPDGIFHELIYVSSNDVGIDYNQLFLARQFIMLAEEYYGLNRKIVLNKLYALDKESYNRGVDLFNEIIDFEISEEYENDNQERFNEILSRYINL